MARKNQVVYALAANQSLAANFNTAPTLIKYLDNCSYQINVQTTDSIGSFAVEASLDYSIDELSGTVGNPGNWVELNLSGGTPAVAAANDEILIDLNQLPFIAIRLAYTASTPGTGTCNIFVACRQLGG